MLKLCQTTDINTSLAHFAQPEVLTQHYKTINTLDVINTLENKGMTYLGCSLAKPHKLENRGYQKHIVMMDTGFKIDDDNTITLLVTNSYNGKTSLQFNLGIFRFVCANGLVAGNSLYKSRVLHKGQHVHDDLATICNELPNYTNNVYNTAQTMLNSYMSPVAAEAYAKEVLEYAYNAQLDSYNIAEYTIQEALQIRRNADSPTNVYTTFNRVQENICKFGLYLEAKPETLESNKSNLLFRKMRPIASIDRYKDVNQFMWDKALEYAA
jgi:hypothetical protein